MTFLFNTLLPNGQTLWYGSALPSLAGDGQFTQGDYFFVMTGAAGLPTFYRCITTGNGATAVFQPFTGEALNVTKVAAAYTALPSDDLILQSANAAVYLPTVPQGDVITVKNTNASGGTVVASAGIDAGHTVTLLQNQVVRVAFDGTQYQILSQYGSFTVA